MSKTVISIFTVPDLCGVPSSTAITESNNLISFCSSLSNSFSKTNSPYLVPSLDVCKLKTKCSLR
uniref:Uncharacterized protein n=1 Tax=Gadus morhua TaxID=8049 RepID=A0A8C5CIK8_GADMO